MKKLFSIYFMMLTLSVFNFACSDSDSAYLENSEEYHQYNEEEKALYAPTLLFKAVYLNDKKLFEEQEPNAYIDFRKKNIDGDTALAVAIKKQRLDFVLKLISIATFDDLKVPNKDNRSFVSLLAEYDYKEAFDIVGDKYLKQAGPLQSVWANFPDIDFADDSGKISAHYVRSASFLDQLETYWFYGVADIQHPWNSFYFSYDDHGDTFLMKAAEYNKVEVLAWFLNKYCGGWGTEENDWWGIFGWAIRNGTFLARKGVEYAQDFDYLWFERSYINISNHDGNTSLHLAAQNGNARAVELIMQCEQRDPAMINNDGQYPITFMLSKIDPELTYVDQNYKDIFDMLLDQVDPLWSAVPMNSFSGLVNGKDNFNLSAVHYAARIRDPYFYNALRKYVQPNSDEDGILAKDRQRHAQ
ncbi:MAG: ankyrin repeat domain-containing protein [Bdellovibrionaceae bacterium]|nr:ankyrin repeat domain-containing protein [Pseudobdellovibrionaceae bacterium]